MKGKLMFGTVNRVRYQNWKGEVDFRRIIPKYLLWGSNEWHQEPQWLLEVWDMGQSANRTFALAGIQEVCGD